MKSIISKTMVLVALCAALFSFAPKPGGEGFEIYLDNKLVLQQFGNEMNAVKNLQVPQSAVNGQLTIKYHHCGRVGKNRIVTIKDEENKILKEWRFTDAAVPVAAMSCNVKDIMNLKKGNSGNTFRLYYSSSELPKGRMLASVVLTKANTTNP
jgi:hypothetical protein